MLPVGGGWEASCCALQKHKNYIGSYLEEINCIPVIVKMDNIVTDL